MVEDTRQLQTENTPLPGGPIEHPSVRHERSDVSFSWIMGIIGASMGCAVVVFFLILAFFHSYKAYQADIKKSSFPLAPSARATLPPEPRLEQLNRVRRIEVSNMFEQEADKEKILNSYPPFPKEGVPKEGFIHIPIDRAIAFLANKLPARKAPAGDQKKENGLLDAGASNSGRMYRGKPR